MDDHGWRSFIIEERGSKYRAKVQIRGRYGIIKWIWCYGATATIAGHRLFERVTKNRWAAL